MGDFDVDAAKRMGVEHLPLRASGLHHVDAAEADAVEDQTLGARRRRHEQALRRPRFVQQPRLARHGARQRHALLIIAAVLIQRRVAGAALALHRVGRELAVRRARRLLDLNAAVAALVKSVELGARRVEDLYARHGDRIHDVAGRAEQVGDLDAVHRDRVEHKAVGAPSSDLLDASPRPEVVRVTGRARQERDLMAAHGDLIVRVAIGANDGIHRREATF
mmetsp:Transcript_13941/g.48554  ORF Transcript_13941/g.48554 Transcript_13941/m.48554 type:complete len:221 (+) Transcript_13941:14208-14870(+)